MIQKIYKQMNISRHILSNKISLFQKKREQAGKSQFFELMTQPIITWKIMISFLISFQSKLGEWYMQFGVYYVLSTYYLFIYFLTWTILSFVFCFCFDFGPQLTISYFVPFQYFLIIFGYLKNKLHKWLSWFGGSNNLHHSFFVFHARSLDSPMGIHS